MYYYSFYFTLNGLQNILTENIINGFILNLFQIILTEKIIVHFFTLILIYHIIYDFYFISP